MIEALIGSLNYSNELYKTDNDIVEFNNNLRNIIHQAYRCSMGTRDICGDKGLTTEEFINYISYELKK